MSAPFCVYNLFLHPSVGSYWAEWIWLWPVMMYCIAVVVQLALHCSLVFWIWKDGRGWWLPCRVCTLPFLPNCWLWWVPCIGRLVVIISWDSEGLNHHALGSRNKPSQNKVDFVCFFFCKNLLASHFKGVFLLCLEEKTYLGVLPLVFLNGHNVPA